MKHKAVFLFIFILSLFLSQQVHAGGESFPGASVPRNIALAYTPPETVSVTFYHLENDGSGLYADDPPIPCRAKGNPKDMTYGCTEYPNYPDTDYPYNSNPYRVPVEDDYLLDVMAHEMDPHSYDNAQPLRAQAVASRTYAYKWTPLSNSASDRQVDVPYAFERYLNTNPNSILNIPNNSRFPCGSSNLLYLQEDVCTATTSTFGQYLSYQGSPIDAQFGSDAGSQTTDGGTDYLIPVLDPISTTCGAGSNYTGRGMSQKGANRWALGNQCANQADQNAYGGSSPWSVSWADYRQILVHYYTGIDILDAAGNPKAPDDRWNLLSHETLLQMDLGQTRDVDLNLQNTSASDWTGDVVLGYQWTAVGGTPQLSGWQVAGSLPSMSAGETNGFPAPITAPTTAGIYTLHLDLKRSGTWFMNGSNGGWSHPEISPVTVGFYQITQATDDASVDPDLGCVFSTGFNEVYLGACFNSADITGGFRFNGILVPQNATIQSAYITFWIDGPYTSPIYVQIFGEAAANSATFSTSDPPDSLNRPLTTNFVTWNITDVWQLYQTRATPDLSPVIQEIVQRSDWNAGNSLSIIIKNANPNSAIHRRVIAFERTLFDPNLHTARLVINYTP